MKAANSKNDDNDNDTVFFIETGTSFFISWKHVNNDLQKRLLNKLISFRPQLIFM